MFSTTTTLVIIFLTGHASCIYERSEAAMLKKIKLFEQQNTDCPSDWARYIGTDNKCIKAFNDAKSFIGSLEYCKQFKNGTLVSIHNVFQNTQIGTHCNDLNSTDLCWFGLYDLNATSGTSSGYSWTDGSIYDYSNWVSGYPYPSGKIVFGIKPKNYNAWYYANDIYYPFSFICMQDL